MCAVEKVVCGMWCVLHRGQRGEGWYVSSTLCMYDIRMGLYWFGVGRGCDVFLWGGRVLKGRSWGRVDVLVCYGCVEVCLYYASVYLC